MSSGSGHEHINQLCLQLSLAISPYCCGLEGKEEGLSSGNATNISLEPTAVPISQSQIIHFDALGNASCFKKNKKKTKTKACIYVYMEFLL